MNGRAWTDVPIVLYFFEHKRRRNIGVKCWCIDSCKYCPDEGHVEGSIYIIVCVSVVIYNHSCYNRMKLKIWIFFCYSSHCIEL